MTFKDIVEAASIGNIWFIHCTSFEEVRSCIIDLLENGAEKSSGGWVDGVLNRDTNEVDGWQEEEMIFVETNGQIDAYSFFDPESGFFKKSVYYRYLKDQEEIIEELNEIKSDEVNSFLGI